MAAKQLMPNQCTPLHFLYGPSSCCLCDARAELERFKAIVKDDMAQVLALLPRYSHTRKLLSERYGIEGNEERYWETATKKDFYP